MTYHIARASPPSTSPWGSSFDTWILGNTDIQVLALITHESESRSVMSDSLWPQGLYSPWNSPGQNTGVGSLSLLWGIFPTQGLNPGLLHCRWILYQLSHKGSPRILEWVAYPFFRGSSWPKNPTGVSCIAGGFFTSWATREVQNQHGNSVFIHETQYHLELSENIFIDQKVLPL